MTTLEAVVLAVIEGITEFLPISSTGHMIIGSSFMKMEPTPFLKLYTVAIQLGAILSVVVLYYKYFFKSVNFYLKLFVAFIPAAIAALLLGDYIDKFLENAVGVAIALLLGGIFLLFVDKIFKNQHVNKSENIDFLTAFKIGLFQCVALFPGVSRSGATIIGGLSQKLTRQAAAEFSFFLAVPTMFAATLKKGYDYYKHVGQISGEEIKLLAIGNVVAFVVALLAIKMLIGFLNKYGFKIFGWYRIIFGAALLAIHIWWFPLDFQQEKPADKIILTENLR
ncbi:MAG: undecaprenyl-diphosphate phosphatase [Bacteroidia bacterium]|nr:undecaprenyl-diphosphate phosphatase [Bacteroidia bacterium]